MSDSCARLKRTPTARMHSTTCRGSERIDDRSRDGLLREQPRHRDRGIRDTQLHADGVERTKDAGTATVQVRASWEPRTEAACWPRVRVSPARNPCARGCEGVTAIPAPQR